MDRFVWSIALFLVLLADMRRIIIMHCFFRSRDNFLRLVAIIIS